MKSVTFTIHGGEVTVEAHGFKGSACEVATKAFEEVLGNNVSGKKLKAEHAAKVAPQYIGVGKQ